ncbi:hypothetical protein [uncultured Hymenobacter sp.]
MSALVLAVNALVQRPLEQWQEAGGGLSPEGGRRLSPLLHEHVTMLS